MEDIKAKGWGCLSADYQRSIRDKSWLQWEKNVIGNFGAHDILRNGGDDLSDRLLGRVSRQSSQGYDRRLSLAK